MNGELTGAGSIYRNFTSFPKCKIFTCPKSAHITAKCCFYCEKRDKCADPCMNHPEKCGQCVKPEGWKEKKSASYPLGSPDLPDHPDIVRAERTGLRPGETPFEDEGVPCPICGKLTDTLYLDVDGDLCGCENCVRRVDAHEYEKNEEWEDADD